MSAPPDFPTQAATDADPTAVPLGPQSPSVHESLTTRLGAVEGAGAVTIQQTNPYDGGPLAVFIGTDDSTSPATLHATLCERIDSILDGAYIGAVREEAPVYPKTFPPDASPAACVLCWRHPLAPHIRRVTADDGRLYDATFSWEESPDTLGLQPAVTRWERLSPLFLKLHAPEPALDGLVSAIGDGIVSTAPRPYITTYETVAPEECSRFSDLNSTATGVRVLKLAFEHRYPADDTEGSIYHLDAEALPEAIAAQTDSGQADPLERLSSADPNSRPSDSGIQLTVTSPPYLDAIDYDTAAETEADWSGNRGDSVESVDDDTSLDGTIDAWRRQQRRIFSTVFDATQKGGYCAVIIGHVKGDDGQWAALPHELGAVMRDIGWTFHERIIWNKTTSRGGRFGTTIQNPHPTYYYPNQQHEEIQIWRKGDIVRRKAETAQLELSTLMKQEVANNVWHIAPVPMNADIDHPCPYPAELVHRLTLLYSHEGDIVADPMAGSGTTPMVASRLGRVGIGTELQSQFVSHARTRLHHADYERRDQLAPSFEPLPSDSPTTTLQRTPAEDSDTTAPAATGHEPVSVSDGGRPEGKGESDEHESRQAGLGDF